MSESGSLFSPKRIVAPVDGSENSTRALKVAVEIASKYGSELIVLNVTTRHAFSPTPPKDATAKYEEYAEQAAKHLVEQAVKFAQEGGANARGKVVWAANLGVVGEIVEIVNEEKADLVVIGSRGLGEFRRLVMGSVSTGVVTHAPCRVLVER